MQQHKEFLHGNIALLKDPFEIKEEDKISINYEKLPEDVIKKAFKKCNPCILFNITNKLVNKMLETKFDEYVESDLDDTISKLEQAERYNPIRPTIDTSKYIDKSTIESHQSL